MKFHEIPQYPRVHYEIDVSWDYIERQLETWNDGTKLHLDPDFQREHVWTLVQQQRYVEHILRGGEVGRQIIFSHDAGDIDWGEDLYLIDGKQRLEAARKFMRSELPVFDGSVYRDMGRMRAILVGFKFRVVALPDRKAMLELYLSLNAGGTPHSDWEINRVRELLRQETKGESK